MKYYTLRMTCSDRVRYITLNNHGRRVLCPSAITTDKKALERKLETIMEHHYYGSSEFKFEILEVQFVVIEASRNN